LASPESDNVDPSLWAGRHDREEPDDFCPRHSGDGSGHSHGHGRNGSDLDSHPHYIHTPFCVSQVLYSKFLLNRKKFFPISLHRIVTEYFYDLGMEEGFPNLTPNAET